MKLEWNGGKHYPGRVFLNGNESKEGFTSIRTLFGFGYGIHHVKNDNGVGFKVRFTVDGVENDSPYVQHGKDCKSEMVTGIKFGFFQFVPATISA